MTKTVKLSVAGRVARISITAPPLNILTAEVQDELRSVIETLRGRSDHNAVFVESGIENVFSAGADVAEHLGREKTTTMLRSAHALIAEILRSPVPTVCIVDGSCLGGAFEFALACDQIVASPASKFGTPEILLGCYPPAAMVLMPQKLPALFAAELIQTGGIFTATELQERGGGLSVTGQTQSLHEVAVDLADSFGTLPRGPLMEATRLLRAGASERFLAQVGGIEQAYLERLLSLNDAKEGPEAFLAKRKPQWDHLEYR